MRCRRRYDPWWRGSLAEPLRASFSGRCDGCSATATDLPAALAAASAEAASAFGDGSVYLEREIRPARHIEVQLLGDVTGRVVAIGERDCSLQRRHQKLVEEAPAPGLTADERRDLHEMAVRVASAAGLRTPRRRSSSARPDGEFYFLEVNTRLQVEHGVTELVAGVDIVREQFRLAAGRAAVGGGARRGRARGRPRRPRHRGPHLGRGSGPRLRADARAGRPLGDAGRARASGSTRRSRRATASRPSTTTSSRSSWSMPATERPRSTACGGPLTRPRSPASRRPCRSTGSWPGRRRSWLASCRRTGSRSTGTARPSAPAPRAAARGRGLAPRRPGPRDRGRTVPPAPPGRRREADWPRPTRRPDRPARRSDGSAGRPPDDASARWPMARAASRRGRRRRRRCAATEPRRRAGPPRPIAARRAPLVLPRRPPARGRGAAPWRSWSTAGGSRSSRGAGPGRLRERATRGRAAAAHRRPARASVPSSRDASCRWRSPPATPSRPASGCSWSRR